MHRRLITLILVCSLALAACGSGKSKHADDSKTRDNTYAGLVSAQPAHSMKYSPTRQAINFWIDTWGQPNKLSYVYMLASNGQIVGYYVFEGLPVTYCASLTPTQKEMDSRFHDNSFMVPAPSVDGVYYSGGQCNQYFGKDASTGAYIEYYAGQGISPLVYSEPLPRPDVKPLGFTTVEQAQAKQP